MKQIYLKFSMLLLCLVVGLSSAWGEDTYYERCNDVSEIINYKEYIIVISSGTKHYAVQQNLTNFLEITTESDGTIKNPSGLIVWEASSESGKISFKCGTKYIFSNGSNTTLSAAGNNPTNWVISELSTGVFKMNIGDTSGRYLAWSGSKFAAYANSNFVNQFKDNSSFGQYSGALYIYKVKKSVKTTPTFSITNITVDYGDKITPVITTNNTDEYIISYSSNKEDVVLADGDELVTMGEGEATITATMASTKNFNETQTAFTVTVNVAKTLTELTVSGKPTKTSYYAGDKFETAGLVVTGTYSDGTSKQLTEGVEWTVDPEILTAGTTSVDVLAGIGEVVSDVFTVNGLSVTKASFETATYTFSEFTSGEPVVLTDLDGFVITLSRGTGSTTNPAWVSNQARIYAKGYLTVKANNAIIQSIEYDYVVNANKNNVAPTIDGVEGKSTAGTWNAESKTWTGSDSEVTFSTSGTAGNIGFTKLIIKYVPGSKTETSLTWSATEAEVTIDAKDNVFPTLTTTPADLSGVTYESSNTKVATIAEDGTVTLVAAGTTTITARFAATEDFAEASPVSYTLTVNSAPFVPTPVEEGYEAVDFTTIEPYASLTGTQSASLDVYQGQSFVVTFSKGEGSTAPKYYNNGTAVRCYVDNTITITAAEPIKYVKVNYDAITDAGKYVDNAASITGLGTTTAVITFSKTCRFTDITVYYKTVGTISVGEKEWATYYTDKAYIMPEGVRGVTVTACSKDNDNYTLTLTDAYEAGSVVPAETPLLINAAQGTYNLYPAPEPGTPATDNLLRGQLEAGQITPETGDNYYYKLTTGSTAPNVGKLGFYWGAANGGVFNLTGCNRAYLVLPQSMNIKAFAFDGLETAISTILSAESNDVPKYNVAGQRIKAPVRGQIYIQNGKKYIAK